MCRNQNSASPIWSEICWFQNIPPSGSLLTPSMAPPLVGSIVAHLDQISPLCPGPPVPTLVPHSLSSLQQPPERGLQGSHRSQDKKPKSSLQPAPSAPALTSPSLTAPATRASLLLLQHNRHGPVSGPLHMLVASAWNAIPPNLLTASFDST